MKRVIATVAASAAVVIVAGSALAANGSSHQRHHQRVSSGIVLGPFGLFGPIVPLTQSSPSVHLDLRGPRPGDRLTIDAGTIVSLLGNRLTIGERVSGGTGDVVVDVTGARVRLDGAAASLDALRVGDQVLVFSNPIGPFVAARD